MSKVVINLSINKENSKLNGIFNDNRIIYNDNNVKTIIDTNDNVKIIRENDEYKLVLVFSNNEVTKCPCLLKQYNKVIDIEIKTVKLIINENNIELKYILLDNDEECDFYLNYEIM